MFWGYFFLYVAVICMIFNCLDIYITTSQTQRVQSNTKSVWEKWYHQLEKRPFTISFMIILIFWLPDIILKYPGILEPDSLDQILQYFHIPSGTVHALNLIDKNTYLNNFHPVVLTLIMGKCIELGRLLFHSDNSGLFLYICLRLLITITIMAYSIKYMIQKHLDHKWIWFVLAFFIIHPLFRHYSMLCEKDGIFGAFVLLFIIVWCDIICYPEASLKMKTLLLGVISIIGMICTRNNGAYNVIGSYLLLLILNRKIRKASVLLLITGVMFSFTLSNVIFPSFDIAPTSKREALSLPFQQTARYLKEYPNDVTDSEKEGISKILDYENLPNLYNPIHADEVKGTFKNESSNQELKNYFGIWLTMLFRHPDSYIAATINQTFGYYTPYGYSEIMDNYSAQWAQEVMAEANRSNFNFYYPEKLYVFRVLYEDIVKTIFSLPFLQIFRISGFYTWWAICLLFYFLKNKFFKGYLLLIPIATFWGICLLSPVNGSTYLRYMYPIIFTLPFITAFSLSYMEKGFSMQKNKDGQGLN